MRSMSMNSHRFSVRHAIGVSFNQPVGLDSLQTAPYLENTPDSWHHIDKSTVKPALKTTMYIKPPPAYKDHILLVPRDIHVRSMLLNLHI